MKIKNSTLKLTILIALSIVLTYCGKKNDVRSYSEEIPKNEPSKSFHAQNIPLPDKIQSKIKWNTPAGWILEHSKSKLRIATFSVKLNKKEAVCTLIPLYGDGGGLTPNIRMWYGTLTGNDIKESELKDFIKKQKDFITSSGLKGILIDFLNVKSKTPDLSMLVSVITLPQKTLFIKMSGTRSLLEKNRNKFLEFSKSINTGE